MAMAVRPERRAASVSPAPMARPTRTVAAMATPRGTMKVIEATLMATWCAATWTMPKRADDQGHGVEEHASKHHGHAHGHAQVEDLGELDGHGRAEAAEHPVGAQGRRWPAITASMATKLNTSR